MKKLVFVLSFVMISSFTLSAQNRKSGRNYHKNNNRSERLEKRADVLTSQMGETYGLSEEQKAKLLVLNKESFTNNVRQYHSNRGDMHNPHKRRGGKGHYARTQDCPMMKGDNKGTTSEFMATPMLMKQHRIDMLQKQVKTYEEGLKAIMTKKQFKDYQKRMEDQLKKME